MKGLGGARRLSRFRGTLDPPKRPEAPTHCHRPDDSSARRRASRDSPSAMFRSPWRRVTSRAVEVSASERPSRLCVGSCGVLHAEVLALLAATSAASRGRSGRSHLPPAGAGADERYGAGAATPDRRDRLIPDVRKELLGEDGRGGCSVMDGAVRQVGDGLSLLVLGSSGVELAPRFCSPWLSGGLHVADDLSAPLAQTRQHSLPRGGRLLVRASSSQRVCWRTYDRRAELAGLVVSSASRAVVIRSVRRSPTRAVISSAASSEGSARVRWGIPIGRREDQRVGSAGEGLPRQHRRVPRSARTVLALTPVLGGDLQDSGLSRRAPPRERCLWMLMAEKRRDRGCPCLGLMSSPNGSLSAWQARSGRIGFADRIESA